MNELAFTMRLKQGMKDEYARRHQKIWPELKSLLKESGVSEYYIFLDSTTHILFAFQKIDGARGSQDLGENEIVKKWWAYMKDIMETNTDNSPVSTPLEKVFSL